MLIRLAEPRGFCSGVTRAIRLVEEALQSFGAPVYVLHEIVHNRHVIKDLEQKGVIFVEDLNEVKPGRPVIFSAHGVGEDIAELAKKLNLKTVDATCPLVKKVHVQIKDFAKQNLEIIVIGKAAHPEIIGTMGQLPAGKKAHIVSSLKDAENLSIPNDSKVGFVTQTTFSTDEVKDIVEYLHQRFPNMQSLKENDICYATAERQKAVKDLSEKTDLMIILGSKNSSNSGKLKEVSKCPAVLIDDCTELKDEDLKGAKTVGISAGASAPEYLVEDLLKHLQSKI